MITKKWRGVNDIPSRCHWAHPSVGETQETTNNTHVSVPTDSTYLNSNHSHFEPECWEIEVLAGIWSVMRHVRHEGSGQTGITQEISNLDPALKSQRECGYSCFEVATVGCLQHWPHRRSNCCDPVEQMVRQEIGHIGRQAGRNTDGRVNRLLDRQTDSRQAGRQTDSLTEDKQTGGNFRSSNNGPSNHTRQVPASQKKRLSQSLLS